MDLHKDTNYVLIRHRKMHRHKGDWAKRKTFLLCSQALRNKGHDTPCEHCGSTEEAGAGGERWVGADPGFPGRKWARRGMASCTDLEVNSLRKLSGV